MTSKTYTDLVNNGPQTMEELGVGGFSTELREDGIRKFEIKRSGRGSIHSGGGITTNVYYINGKHKPHSIVKKWLKVNDDVVEKSSVWSVHQRIASHGREFKKASRELLGPFENLGQVGGGSTKIDTCPLCGTDIDSDLPTHLPCEQ